MRTIPLAAAAVLLDDRGDLRDALSGCGRLIGTRVELDLDAAEAAAGAELSELLEAYYSRCEALWQVAAGGPGHGGYVAVRRVLADHQQITGKKNRADLVEVYEALASVPTVADLVDEATAAAPDVGLLAEMASSLRGGARFLEQDVLELTMYLEGLHALPETLGGVPWPGEMQRVLTVTCRQAGWRDRRVRRLARVRVEVDELWAHSADLEDAVSALPPRS